MRSAERPPMTGARIEEWTGGQFGARVDEAMRIYVRAMRYPDHTGVQRAVSARKHVSLSGFACRAAVLDDDTLVGFGYGYTTKPGQWWHDLVRRALDDVAGREWLVNAFELSELHVLPEYQGLGVGRQLLSTLASGLPHTAMLLSTPDSDTRAFRLYRDTGFVDLARNYLFPGDSRPFAVLGARLPLRDGR
ncbi:MAG: GNAT family N-acetyltransferase [Jatrophihabitans sp.]|uniref:GNAT family N-acetyltransferase n=1 Tax=Jatrophihabitans sp. TaxID=1932789 RepID=UPI00390F2B7A